MKINELEINPVGHNTLLTDPQYTIIVDTPGELDWYKLGQHFATLGQQDPHEFGQPESDMMIVAANKEQLIRYIKELDRLGATYKLVGSSHKHPEIHSEAWSEKYKRSIDCDNPKGFSQRAHCQGRKKTNEDINNLPDWETIVAIAAAAKMTPMAIKALWSTAKGAYKIKKFADKMGIKLADNLVGESNPFTDARMNAIKAGKKHFTVKGKKYPVTGDTSDEEEAIANEAEQQELPIDMNRIFTRIQQLESSGVITPQEADDMRRAAQALAAGRKTILPDRILQLLTMVA